MFQFENPYYFLFLIPLVAIVLIREVRRNFQCKIQFSNVAVIRTLHYTVAQRLAPFVSHLLYLGIFLWIIALARPQFGEEEHRVRTEGIAMVICIDRSNSMSAMDFVLEGQAVSRIDVVKRTLRDFICGNETLSGRSDDMIALLVFGGYVDALSPLTLDHTTLLEMLEQVQLPGRMMLEAQAVGVDLLAEEGATAIGDALAMAADRLKESEAKSKVILFLSDGDQTFGTLAPMEGAEIAKTLGIKVYTIGIGSHGEAPFPANVFGPNVLGRNQMIMRPVSMDETILMEIAEFTGGKYFNARNTRALENVYAEIDQLEKTIHEGRVYTQYTELFQYPLFVGLGLISLYVICVCTRFRRLP